MKNNSFARAAFAAALALILLTHVSTALAKPLGPEESEVNIRFEEGNAGVPPVDPDDPGLPLVPDEENPGEGTGQSGSLALNYISPITFGVKQIYGIKWTYNATTMRPFLQVTDLRGTGKGWRVTAEARPFTDESGAISLKGSVITLLRGKAVSAYIDIAPPDPVPTVELPTIGGHIENVVEAGDGEGLGTWVTRWYPSVDSPENENDSVTLTVLPGTATPEKHKAKIIWTLISDMTSQPED